MKNSIIKIVIVLGLVLTLFSCEKEIELTNPNAERKNVVNAIFNIDSTMKVLLYKSNLPLSSDDEFDLITNAKVEIAENGIKEELEFSGGKIIEMGIPEGYYVSPKTISEGKTYSLTVSGEGIKEMNATIKAPKKVIVNTPILKNTKNGQELSFSIDDASDEENYYEIAVYYSYIYKYFNGQDTFVGEPVFEQAYLEVKNENKSPLEAETAGSLLLITDEIFNGKTYNLDLILYTVMGSQEDEFGGGDPIDNSQYEILGAALQISTINKALYEYNLSVQKQQESGGDPFSEAVQIKSNIENGLGIFGIRNTAYFTIDL